MGTQGTGRKRSTKKERSTAEDDALNLIAREAEARLAAKRAARAEAREIRMKELERQQKELSDDDERMSVGSRGSVRVEDRDYLEKGSRAASALTAGTLTSLGGTSSRRGSCETAVTLDAETSLREIKDALAEVEEKYRKAMVSNAQLDNEKSNLMYQVDTLKDSLMELEEMLSESQRGYEDKVKELEREKHAHSVLQFQFSELKETLKQSEELLNKHGILLGPDLNINGDIGVDADGSSGADPSSQTATETTAPLTEGNSMLGSTEETQLRSRGEEELNQQELRETEQPKGIDLSSDNVAGVDALEAPREELPNGEAQIRIAEDSVEESDPRNNLKVDFTEHVITEAQGLDDCSPKIKECATSCEKHVSETDSGEAKNKSSSIDSQADEDRDSCNVSVEQDDNQPVVDENKSEKSDLQQTAGQHSTKESSPDDSVPAVADTELQKEPENNEEAENNEAEETPSKSQLQGAAASGKKKRKKKRGKKKGGGNEDKNQQKKEEEDEEKHERTNQIEMTTTEGVPATQQDGPVSEVLRESRMDQAENEACLQQTEDVGKEEAAKPTEPCVHSETPQEPVMDHVTDDLDKQPTSETDMEVVETVEVTETFSNIETSKQKHVESEMDGQSEENGVQTETVEAAEAAETFANNQTLGESLMDQVTEEGKEEPILETDKVAVIEVEEPLMTETLSHTEARQEIGEERVLEEPEEVPSSETGTAEEAVENTESYSHDETLDESSTDLRTDEPEEEQSLETADVEVEPSLSPAPQGELGSPDPIDNITDVESSDGCDNTCPSSIDRTDLLMTGDNSTWSLTGTAAEEDTGLTISELKSVNNEAEEKENSEDDPQALSADTTDRSETRTASDSQDNTSLSVSSNGGLSDGLGCLSGSEAPPELSDATQTETSTDATEPGTKTESSSDSQDGESSELEPGRAEKEEALTDEGLVELHSSPPGETEDAPTSTINADVLDGVKSPELAAGLDDVESQTLEGDDHIDDSAAEEAPESEETKTTNALETPHEAAEAGCSVEHESEELEDENDEHGETLLCPLEEQQRETSEGKSEASPTDLQDSEEEEEDDEGQSFDFDDMDVELAVATNPVEAQLEETEEGVEVPSDEKSTRGSDQSNSEPNENTQKELVENDDKEALDVGERVEAAATPDGNASIGNVCENPKEAPEEEDAVVPEQPVAEEGELFAVGESGGDTENVDPTENLSVEEGLDAMKQEFQGDQAAGKNEPQQMRKDGKKNSKKGKAKGKEDCKMS